MKLYLNATSPFARVARIIALEKGLQDQLELCWSDPWTNDPALLQANPVGRIPVLVTEDGRAIAESLLIAQYLDNLTPSPRLLPPAELAAVLQRTGLGYGLMEAAFTTVIGRKHDAEADQSVLGQRRLQAIDRSIQALASQHRDDGQQTLDLSIIVTAVALDYVLFRLPEIDWRSRYPELAAWHQRVTVRANFTETAFN
ncbi:glutathione S-transferase N-terminal domain-containing protein [Halopseudomonas bauzanensis]|uniref:Glutathione S-transferase n=1 Tax=Halopseudomonas bauzanensis TaxID=653930 RepID=A0A1H9QA45_9GAMM|nr:glutathione S-transferase N-terminal domain-containing protein [Halopseudomonas bauzanensis]SER57391.1 glutathione S-transferase [Halopseudomonas bauzanensis]SFL67859.1 glutathione S-transferase [Halopseudomonas bauzanensis]